MRGLATIKLYCFFRLDDGTVYSSVRPVSRNEVKSITGRKVVASWN